MDNIVKFPSAEPVLEERETLGLEADKVLLSASEEDFSNILVIGRKLDGFFFVASNTNDIGKLLTLLEGCKQIVVANIDTDTY